MVSVLGSQLGRGRLHRDSDRDTLAGSYQESLYYLLANTFIHAS